MDEENRVEIQLSGDITERILSDLQLISNIKDLENLPLIMTFRSCKYNIQLSSKALNFLMNYLSNYSHLIVLQVVQTWFEIDIAPEIAKLEPIDEIIPQRRELPPRKIEIVNIISNRYLKSSLILQFFSGREQRLRSA